MTTKLDQRGRAAWARAAQDQSRWLILKRQRPDAWWCSRTATELVPRAGTGEEPTLDGSPSRLLPSLLPCDSESFLLDMPKLCD